MNNEFSKLTEEAIYCYRNGLIDDELGRAMLHIFQAGVCDPAIANMFSRRAAKHQFQQAFYGSFPFKTPKMPTGDYILGLDQNNQEIRSHMQYLNAHTLTVAGSGAGKTMLSRYKVLQLAQHLRGLFLFDLRKREFRILRKYLARLGITLHILDNKTLRFNPLQIPAGVGVSDWIPRIADTLVSVLGLPPRASKLLQTKLFPLYQQFQGRKEGYPTLFDLFEAIKQDKDSNPQARLAFLDSLEPVLWSLGPKVLAWRYGWTTHDLAQKHLVFELAGCSETDKNLLLNSLILSEFCSRIFRNISNPKMNLLIVFDEAQRLCSASSDLSAIADLIGLVRGSGIGLDMSLQSLNAIHPHVISNTATKVLGRCGSLADYTAMGHSMGLNPDQIQWAQLNLEPGLFIGQLGEGSWRVPFIFRVPKMTFPSESDTEYLDSNPFPELKTCYASEYDNWAKTPIMDTIPPAHTKPALFDSEQEYALCKAIADSPMQPSSIYPKLAGISSKSAKPIREHLVSKAYIRQHQVDSGSRGRTSILLEALPKGIQALRDYQEDLS